ncbi:hypothetical protein DFH11DRAFT_471272 [Phellopilus nigrolimitatus]|nr:hypothetical protein DFH11DRAFT_471272 [Phellopilus nigrolimitatus]
MYLAPARYVRVEETDAKRYLSSIRRMAALGLAMSWSLYEVFSGPERTEASMRQIACRRIRIAWAYAGRAFGARVLAEARYVGKVRIQKLRKADGIAASVLIRCAGEKEIGAQSRERSLHGLAGQNRTVCQMHREDEIRSGQRDNARVCFYASRLVGYMCVCHLIIARGRLLAWLGDSRVRPGLCAVARTESRFPWEEKTLARLAGRGAWSSVLVRWLLGWRSSSGIQATRCKKIHVHLLVRRRRRTGCGPCRPCWARHRTV